MKKFELTGEFVTSEYLKFAELVEIYFGEDKKDE